MASKRKRQVQQTIPPPLVHHKAKSTVSLGAQEAWLASLNSSERKQLKKDLEALVYQTKKNPRWHKTSGCGP